MAHPGWPYSAALTPVMQSSVTELPYNRLLGLEPAPVSAAVQLPAGPQYLNHLGTVHAGALLSLAEAASGEFLLTHFSGGAGLIPVVRRMEAKFRKPASGRVTAAASVSPEALAQLEADLATRGRALVCIPVQVHDESGTLALTAEVEWFIQKA